jgi:flagellar assembly protein FliH
MLSSNRIIAAEELGEVEPFSIGALPSGRGKPVRGRANGSPNPEADPMAQSFEAGYRKGVTDTAAHGREARDQEERTLGSTLGQRIDTLARSLESEFAQFEEQAAARLVDLAVDLARQVVRATLSVRRDTIVPVVQEALATLLSQHSAARLFVNPADAELIRRELAPVLERRSIEVCPDPKIAAGGCSLVSAHAEVDATLQTAWRRVVAAIGRSQAEAPEISR